MVKTRLRGKRRMCQTERGKTRALILHARALSISFGKKTNIFCHYPYEHFSMNDLLLAGRKKDILRSAVTNIVEGSNALTCLLVGVSQLGVRCVHEKPL